MVIQMNRIPLGIIFYFCLTCISHAHQNDFDKICKIYSTVLSQKMDAQTGSKFINDNIKLTVHNKDTLKAHSNIYLVPQQKRYTIFKEIAEHSLKVRWDCAAMKQLLNHPPK